MKKSMLLAGFLAVASVSPAQVRETWTQRYNADLAGKGHRPVAMQLDLDGNAYVAGTIKNATNGTEYVVLKYTSDGPLAWAGRYASTNGVAATAAFALGQDGCSYVTGSGGTVKFGSNGAVVWTAPYAGRDVAVDTNRFVYITGFSSVDYATAKLSSAGSNVWVRTYDVVGQTDISSRVAVDGAGNVYVGGWEAYVWLGPLYRYYRPSLLKYNPSGTFLWSLPYFNTGTAAGGVVKALIPDGVGNIYVAGDGGVITYHAAKVSPVGQVLWDYNCCSARVSSGAIDRDGDFYMTGEVYNTVRISSSNAAVVWLRYLDDSKNATGLALDLVPNVYVTGTFTNSATGNDWATIKYDKNGNQIWVVRYNGPANGDDGAVAIAVGGDGAVYVTGYSANASGGTDITTIKYIQPVPIQREPDGSMRLQSPGTPGGTNGIQASTNLQSWLDLGLVPADTNGIFTFEDTNAPAFDRRFYRWYVP